jgi:hypothetical protein
MRSTDFADAFDALLSVAAKESHAARVAEMRQAFERRAGAFGPEDAWFEARSRAFWDDALTTQGFADAALDELPETARAWARCLRRAHRGLFLAERREKRHVLTDLWSGAEFVLDELDLASQDALLAPSGPFDARIAATLDPARVALLPGAVFHPEDATTPLHKVLDVARERGMSTGDTLDALLRMELSLRTLSRVKPAYAYRPESLTPPR